MKLRTVLLSLFLGCAVLSAQNGLTLLDAASGRTVVAPGSLVSAFGTALSVETMSATLPLPQLLGTVRVTVVDSAGNARPASIVYASPLQVNFVLPAGTPPGEDLVTIMNGPNIGAQGVVLVQSSAPGIFTANGTGTGVAAALGIRVVDVVGPHVTFPVYSCKGVLGTVGGTSGIQCNAVPIDTGLDSPVFVALFGTGIAGAKNVTVTVGGQHVPVMYAGPQGFPGLDQVNIGLPLTLRGAGLVNVVVTADGQASNPVQLSIQ